MLAFNLRPALQFARTERKEVKGREGGRRTDSDEAWKFWAKHVLAPTMTFSMQHALHRYCKLHLLGNSAQQCGRLRSSSSALALLSKSLLPWQKGVRRTKEERGKGGGEFLFKGLNPSPRSLARSFDLGLSRLLPAHRLLLPSPPLARSLLSFLSGERFLNAISGDDPVRTI